MPLLNTFASWMRDHAFVLVCAALMFMGIFVCLPGTNSVSTQPLSWSASGKLDPTAKVLINTFHTLPTALSASVLGSWSQPAPVPDAVDFTTFSISDRPEDYGKVIVTASGENATCSSPGVFVRNAQGNGCTTWSPREETDGTKTRSSVTGGLVVAENTHEPKRSLVRVSLRVMNSTVIGTSYTRINFAALLPDPRKIFSTATDTNASSQDPSQPLTITYAGFGTTYTSAGSLVDSLSVSDGHGGTTTGLTSEELARVESLTERYFNSNSLLGSETLTLFTALYKRQLNLDAQAKNATPATPRSCLRSGCYWMGEFTLHTGPSLPVDLRGPNSVQVTARLWSTCGDFVTAELTDGVMSDVTDAATRCLAALLLLGLLPLFLGIVKQAGWVNNSRGRCLRVSRLQVIVILFVSCTLLSPAQYVLVWTAPSYALYVALCVFLWLCLVMSITLANAVSVGRGTEAPDGRFHCNGTYLAALCAMEIGLLYDSMFRVVFSTAGLLVLGLLCWAPQWVVCIKENGWTGILAPLAFGFGATLCVPLVCLACFVPSPFTLPDGLRCKLLISVCLIATQTLILMAFRGSDGHHFLPSWMTPWRHHYGTTVEAQRAALTECGDCPICRGPLEEMTEEGDELWITPCKHLFHKMCLDQWLMERMECPICRSPLPDP